MNLKKTAVILIVFFAAFIAWNYAELIWPSRACEEPIGYTLGTFDRRFGISRKAFLSALFEAEAIWEKPVSKELFIYAPETGELAVNLIYDYRQETTQTLSVLEGSVKEGESSYDVLQAKYERLKNEYDNAKSVYNLRVKAFDEENNAYQIQVEIWNNSRRNSRTQFEQLEEKRVELEADIRELKVLEGQLNTLVRDINTLVETLNRLAKSLNLNVKTYNTIGASRGESFTGGLYHSVDGEQSIDVYEFESRAKLVRILAHEFGHALGLEHVDNPEAVMYYLNEDEAEILTDADIAALRALCYTEDIKN